MLHERRMNMGLFDGGAKKEALENEIMQALSKQPILKDLLLTIEKEAANEPWLTSCQGYYDNLKRVVTCGPDVFEVKWTDTHYEKNPQGQLYPVEEILGRKGYAYTKSGYRPIHGHKDAKGKEDVSVARAVFLWTKIVQEGLQAKFPNCDFSGNITLQGENASFTYQVPALTWKNWF